MSESEKNVGTAIESEFEGQERARPQPRPQTAPGAGFFHILKAGQGTRVRWGTAIGGFALALAAAYEVYYRLQAVNFGAWDFLARTLAPIVVLVVAAIAIFHFVGRHARVVDFMIATEGEMKKVNWSSRKEIWGSTKVVIVTVLALGMVLALVDLLFIIFFNGIGVLRTTRQLMFFSGGGEGG